jgi:hypothetical protein
MIRIRHSAKPYQELDLEGSNHEFSELRSAILGFCDGLEGGIEIPAESEFDPSPYQQKLAHLCLCKTEDLLLISVVGGKLLIPGQPRFLRHFAENLLCEAHHTSSVPYHVHFDRAGCEERISEASLNIVLSLKS